MIKHLISHPYFLILVGLFLVPLSLMLFLQWETINFGYMFLVVSLLGVSGIVGDIWATRQSNKDRLWIWDFNSRTMLGSKLLGHPLEEYLFFVVVIPYVILFWELVNKILQESRLSAILGGVFILLWMHILAFVFYHIQTRKIRSKHIQ